MQKPSHPFDSPNSIETFFQDLKKLNLSEENFNDLSIKIDKTLITIPFNAICISKGTKLYRARKQPVFNDGMFENISELTIRADQDIKTFGRANTPGKAIFYCSLDKLTAAREVTQWQLDDLGTLIKKGITLFNYHPYTQFMTISEWITKEDLYFVTVFEDEEITKWPIMTDPMINYLNERYIFDTNRYETSRKMVFDFFSSEFIKQEINGQFDYYYSAYYADSIYKLSERGPFAGLIYLSVAFDLEGYNFAIPRNKLNKLEFVSADYCYTFNSKSTTGFEDHKIVVAPDSRATLQADNSLIWRDVWGKEN